MEPGKSTSSTSKAEPKKEGLWSELIPCFLVGGSRFGFSKGMLGIGIRAFTFRGYSDWLVLMSIWLLKCLISSSYFYSILFFRLKCEFAIQCISTQPYLRCINTQRWHFTDHYPLVPPGSWPCMFDVMLEVLLFFIFPLIRCGYQTGNTTQKSQNSPV